MKTVAVGDVIPEHHVVVRADAMKPMALLLRDPNPIHWDPGALRALGLDERPINQGPLNVSYIWEAIAAWTGEPTLIRSLRVRFVSNALAGDRLVVGGEVISHDPEKRRVTCSVWVHHADGQPVLTGTAAIDTGVCHDIA
ncbi:MaoC family dehydratase [Rhodococcus koreensis]|uniref:MaoC family dehydratase n=1 Tax=Rhodococcus koreensis TaxID=99653 RepID=UPI0036711EB0